MLSIGSILIIAGIVAMMVTIVYKMQLVVVTALPQ
jgi:hypothetical protein